jgi:hypothetical protein
MNNSIIFTTTDWLTLALVVITAFYAWATFKILRANQGVVAGMKEQTEAQFRPYVVISVTPRVGTTLLLLEIQNTGKSPALNLNMKIDKDFYYQAEKNENKNIAKLPAFSKPIACLAPGTRLSYILGVGHTIFGDNVNETLCPKIFQVQADYEFADKKYSENNIIDMHPLLRSSVMHDPVSEELKHLRESLVSALKK